MMSAIEQPMNSSYATTRKFEKVCEILDRNGRDPAKLIPILQQVQDEYRYLPEAVLTYVATSLGVPPARVYGVATFYAHFTLKPKGKYVVRLCNGTACNVKGSMDLLEAIKKRLGLGEGQDTTNDMLFTVETVSCLGACGLAPAMVVNETVYGQMTPEKAVGVVEDILAKEASA
jgi:NADH-quinone oxidoreductase subunit E